MSKSWITDWRPDDEVFWKETGERVARRNLAFSIFAEFLGFSVWVLWAVVASQLNKAGFSFSPSELFVLVSIPPLVGAFMRLPYTMAVPRFGGRNWTVASALLLLVPTLLLSVVVQNPDTPYWLFLLVAGTAGLGGGNFSSSMANISFFYPDERKGFPLGLNAAGGNIGVAVTLALVPLLVTIGIFGALFGGPQSGEGLYLQNAGLVFVPLILIAAGCAWLFMDNLAVAASPARDQAKALTRRDTWIMSVIYIGTFGSFIGFSSALPVLIDTQFPQVSVALAFLGPLVGSLVRPLGGYLSDRVGGAKVTVAVFALMIASVAGVLFFLGMKESPWAFAGFLAAFVLVFVGSGVGNGSTFRMIPVIFRTQMLDDAGDGDETARERAVVAAKREAAAVLGFCGAIGAFGGFLIPQMFALSRTLLGGPQAALAVFAAFYLLCGGLTWFHYLRTVPVRGRAPSLAAEAGV
ncbi:MAG: NarK family nitrate/nitrite MFS transporter [Thermoleophilaceae bacterium]|nr:NarK family nitrate/nitrite MFS transporter [Thermoleophilaceae bacterium]